MPNALSAVLSTRSISLNNRFRQGAAGTKEVTASRIPIRRVAMLFAAAILIAFVARPCTAGPQEIAGKIVHLRGQVDLYSARSRSWQPARANQLLAPGDVLQTGATGWAALLLADETLLQLNRNSRFLLKKVAVKAGWDQHRGILPATAGPARSEYEVNRGEVWIRNKNKDINIKIDSPTVTASIRGTELNLRIDTDETTSLTVLEGRVQAGNDLGALEVGAREQVIARRGQPLSKSLLLTPEDAVQWTIPLPFLYDAEGIPTDVMETLQMVRTGELSRARGRLEEILQRRPRDAAAWQLLAVTDIMRGDKTAAVEAARQAAAAVPASASALLTLSYAYQASFDLDQALTTVKKALAVAPGNVPALVQYAQLRFGMDDIEDAKHTITRAAALAPDNAAVQNLLGFILLAENRTDAAEAAFRKAVELDPGSGEPHLGLGLARMRRGDVPAAFEEMSAAVLLEPRRSLFVTYWGKMLYQIERHDRALDMLNVARVLDPRDPTPELYRAIVLRDLNRPTEAVGAINQAIKLNDNRAVYRSRFLLDSDRAVKNVDQAILFNQLGLLEWAKSKATASVKDDFTNSSAHLFLAGSLQEATDRSWAMQNEYLLARILMPANMNSFNTFNDYTSFFERPSLNATATGAIGGDGTRSISAIPYGAIPAADLAFGAQFSYDRTDGWRETNGERSGNVAALIKWDATVKDSFMGVFSHQSANMKDKLYPRFEYDNPPAVSNWTDSGTSRLELGYHRRFNPDSHLLVYLARLKSEGVIHQVPPTAYGSMVIFPFTIDIAQDQVTDNRYLPPYWQAQAQYMHRIGRQQITLGTNQYWGENNGGQFTFRDTRYYLGGVLLLETEERINTYRDCPAAMQSYYLSDTLRVNSWLTVEGAVYLDRMTNSNSVSGAAWTVNEFSPRAGLILTPTRSDTIRLAAFRYLLPFISSRLDPTDVAGIPAMRNNQSGAVMSEGHAVWEREWPSGFFSAGFFYTEKNYDYGTIDTGGGTIRQTAYGRFKGGEARVNQILREGLGLNLAYSYRTVRDETLTSADREDQLASAGLRYVHHTGISAGLTQGWRRIHLSAQNRDDENIWITDARLGYEFPRKKAAVTLEMRNIFNHRFNWVTDYFSSWGRWPSREVVLTLTVNI